MLCMGPSSVVTDKELVGHKLKRVYGRLIVCWACHHDFVTPAVAWLRLNKYPAKSCPCCSRQHSGEFATCLQITPRQYPSFPRVGPIASRPERILLTTLMPRPFFPGTRLQLRVVPPAAWHCVQLRHMQALLSGVHYTFQHTRLLEHPDGVKCAIWMSRASWSREQEWTHYIYIIRRSLRPHGAIYTLWSGGGKRQMVGQRWSGS